MVRVYGHATFTASGPSFSMILIPAQSDGSSHFIHLPLSGATSLPQMISSGSSSSDASSLRDGLLAGSAWKLSGVAAARVRETAAEALGLWRFGAARVGTPKKAALHLRTGRYRNEHRPWRALPATRETAQRVGQFLVALARID